MAGVPQLVAFISMPGSGEWMVILIIGLLIFGRRLPDVARSLGKSVNEFKKGMREFQDSADEVARDVDKVTNEVASDVKNASGMNDYGYQDPNATTYNAGQYQSPESTDASSTSSTDVAGPADATPGTVESGVSPTSSAPAKPDENVPSVEPMK